ncbi:MAG: metal ABC transporter ATP-binding protein [Firmicutes bacterium]|nr:metal ABC transporter ATP-binding protein [Bacillota bacterium]
MASNPIIEVDNATFKYTCHAVLNNINLTINAGDCVGITGPNGSGKSTLLKLILGNLKPLKGKVKLFGSEAYKNNIKHKVGYVPQKATSFNNGFPTTVFEMVVAGRTAGKGLFKPFSNLDYAKAEDTLKRVGLFPLRNRKLSELSGGQQQRVFIARAIATNPKLLILDEPTVGIDAQAQVLLLQLLKDLNKRYGMTLVVVSHELDLISPLINRQVCLDKKICHCSCFTEDEKKAKDLTCSKSAWVYQ